MKDRDRDIDFYVRITPKGGQWDNPECKFNVGPFREVGAAENAVIAALQGGALTAAIEIKTKPPIESPLPSYHELLQCRSVSRSRRRRERGYRDERAALQGEALTAAIEIKTEPPIESPLPSYHELLTHLCGALNIDEGSFTVESLVVEIKDRIKKLIRDSTK